MNKMGNLFDESPKFHHKYRVDTIRFKEYDYASEGGYFVTICANMHRHFFGKIIQGRMRNSKIGNVIQECWDAIPLHFPFVILDAFVIMPNHIHGILIFNRCQNEERDARSCVSTKKQATSGAFGPQARNLASVIRGFKIGVTKNVHKDFGVCKIWQTRYYERVIRNEFELKQIREYIFNNPTNWENERNNTENLCI
jgi:putative transposase